jgi:hypothetical protein
LVVGDPISVSSASCAELHPLRLPQIHDRRMARAAAQVRPRPACLFPATPAGCQRRQTGCPSVGGLGPEGWSPTGICLAAAPAPAGTATAGRPPTGSAWGTGDPDRPGRRQRPAGARRSQGRLPEIAALSCQTRQSAPKSDIDHAERPGLYSAARPLTCGFSGVSEGTRTPDTQDHN